MERGIDIGNLILEWAELVESEVSGKSVSGGDGIVCFFDGKWHNSSGETVDISPEKESSIVNTISKIETANYENTPDLIMMDDSRTIEDIADYLECEQDDMFLFFRFPTSEIGEWKSPSSEDPRLSGSLYFLASANEYAGIGWSEVADISGNIESVSVFSKLMTLAFSWLNRRGIKLVIQNCREDTSERFFTSRLFLKKFLEFGFTKLDDVDQVEVIDGERFHLNVLVDQNWWGSLSERQKELVLRTIMRNQ